LKFVRVVVCLGTAGLFRDAYGLFIPMWWYWPHIDSAGTDMEITSTSPSPDYCHLEHRVFASFHDPLFRKAESDCVPVMMVELGDQEAATPLNGMQREFGIADVSKDGQMLTLIARSLDFVAGLRICDELPSEVLTWEASWEPDAAHLSIANAKLQWQLVAWLNYSGAGNKPSLDPGTLLQVADDPSRRQLVQRAFAKAADVLGLADSEAVVGLVEELAQELAYIEALRDRLPHRVGAMRRKLNRIAQAFRCDASHRETLTRVRHLAATAVTQIGRRFDELDAQTCEVMSALRNADGQRTFIRSHRDWLYVTQRAWHPLLVEWDVARISFDDGIVMLLNRTYRFLAPRFRPVTEWIALSRPTQKQGINTRMKWSS
jgi:hypothetical protein